MNLASSKMIGTAALVALLCGTGPATAQSDRAITQDVLRDPWVRALAVLESSSGPIAGAKADTHVRLDGVLEPLEVAIGGFETQVDRVIDRLVGDPQFAYVAAQTSHELSAQLAEVYSLFTALYTTLGVQDRGDVVSAQAALADLRDVLNAGSSFERDVVQVLGSGSRQQIVELATRWWNGEERAIAVKKRVAELRQGSGGQRAEPPR
ncbi:MAG: hypothetical protein ABI794_19150 [Betaproteobacteria bacterium]